MLIHGAQMIGDIKQGIQGVEEISHGLSPQQVRGLQRAHQSLNTQHQQLLTDHQNLLTLYGQQQDELNIARDYNELSRISNNLQYVDQEARRKRILKLSVGGILAALGAGIGTGYAAGSKDSQN